MYGILGKLSPLGNRFFTPRDEREVAGGRSRHAPRRAAGCRPNAARFAAENGAAKGNADQATARADLAPAVLTVSLVHQHVNNES